MKFCHVILETLGYHNNLELSISPGLELVPGHGGQTDRITVANTRYSYASSRAWKRLASNRNRSAIML